VPLSSLWTTPSEPHPARQQPKGETSGYSTLNHERVLRARCIEVVDRVEREHDRVVITRSGRSRRQRCAHSAFVSIGFSRTALDQYLPEIKFHARPSF
jgi:hypothetical protein